MLKEKERDQREGETWSLVKAVETRMTIKMAITGVIKEVCSDPSVKCLAPEKQLLEKALSSNGTKHHPLINP